MKFYLDENLPKRVADALSALEGDKSPVEVDSTEIFNKGIQDEELLIKLKENNGILITNDLKMRKAFKGLLRINKITAFFIAFPKAANFAEKYQRIISNWEKIKNYTAETNRPFLCEIKKRGDFRFFTSE